jgi:hypothetical protein
LIPPTIVVVRPGSPSSLPGNEHISWRRGQWCTSIPPSISIDFLAALIQPYF